MHFLVPPFCRHQAQRAPCPGPWPGSPFMQPKNDCISLLPIVDSFLFFKQAAAKNKRERERERKTDIVAPFQHTD